MTGKSTGIVDRKGREIREGDWVSLDGNMTADDSLGLLPNGFFFDEDDVFQVWWDDRCKAWGLRLGVQPNEGADYIERGTNTKYVNHAYSLLNDGDVTVVGAPDVA